MRFAAVLAIVAPVVLATDYNDVTWTVTAPPCATGTGAAAYWSSMMGSWASSNATGSWATGSWATGSWPTASSYPASGSWSSSSMAATPTIMAAGAARQGLSLGAIAAVGAALVL